MNVATIAVPQETAIQKINDIEALNPKQRTPEDDALLSVFKAVRKHNARVINIADAFRHTGLNEFSQPRLAIARADWKDVGCTTSKGEYESQVYAWTSAKFFESGIWRVSDKVSAIELPAKTFPRHRHRDLRSAVPHIPAELRPKFHLRNYHILFEVQKWEEYPVDPFLLKHVAGGLYIVLAEWELTELEASLLGSIRGAS
jgi:hypothetical protein